MGSLMGLFIVVLSAVGAVWGLSVFGSPDAARDEFIARTFMGAASISLIPLYFLYWVKRIPEEFDQDQRNQIATLQKRFEPSFQLLCGKDRPFVYLESWRGNQWSKSNFLNELGRRWINLQIVNTSGVLLTSVNVKFKEVILAFGHHYDGFVFQRFQNPHNDTFDLRPGESQEICVAVADETSSKGIGIGWDFAKPGALRHFPKESFIVVQAMANESVPREYVYHLFFNKDGILTIKESSLAESPSPQSPSNIEQKTQP